MPAVQPLHLGKTIHTKKSELQHARKALGAAERAGDVQAHELAARRQAIAELQASARDDEALGRALAIGDVCAIGDGTVACDENGRVVKIRLRGRGLRGRLPARVPRMERLTTLDASDNALEGTISEEFLLAMPNLVELHLNLNTLEGPIPKSIGTLTSLEVLNLDGGFTERQRRFDASVPVDKREVYGFPGVHFGNQLSGSVPAEIGNLVKLRELNLHRNMLGLKTDRLALPASVGNLVELESMDVSGNQLHGAIPQELATLPRLRTLNLDDNFISGFIPSDWSSALALESLIVEGNFLSGTLPRFLPRNLTFLDVHENLLTGSINELSRLKRLEGVLLDRCRFTGPVTLSKASLPNLKMISLANNAGLCGALPDLPFATKEQKEAECDKPWELCQLWPETAGTLLGLGSCQCAAPGEGCSIWELSGRKETCCEEGTCLSVPFEFGGKQCVPCSDAYQKCGGKSFDGPTCCKRGLTCTRIDDDRSECLPCNAQWEQCAGALYDGPKCCASGNSCVYFDAYYSQCQPSSVLL